MVCRNCGEEYKVLVDNDKEFVTVEEVGVDISYCPFCGCECDDWRDNEDGEGYG
jgi:hypothetical protein